ncbi:hypothetical protein PsorP6_017215 [Peronosclerospora sorghi]|uniref:Uncharacterized protein n=1 Tax=Peronosclerospora sorghi TaxID=230839 RepID=A0ACC0WF17_9STRA|nr:hypothetical protein PsorP6_017215 [Peronosclerospora sorghi]
MFANVSRPGTMTREMNILKTLDHPNIIKLYDVCEGNRHLHLTTELCTVGELSTVLLPVDTTMRMMLLCLCIRFVTPLSIAITVIFATET